MASSSSEKGPRVFTVQLPAEWGLRGLSPCSSVRPMPVLDSARQSSGVSLKVAGVSLCSPVSLYQLNGDVMVGAGIAILSMAARARCWLGQIPDSGLSQSSLDHLSQNDSKPGGVECVLFKPSLFWIFLTVMTKSNHNCHKLQTQEK